LLLLAPWFAVLGWIYWRTAPPRFAAARGFDVASIISAVALAAVGMALGLRYEPVGHHPIIREIAASVIAYKAFLLVLGAAWFWRGRITAPAAGRRSGP
jgi:hypothetical protein